MNKKQILIFLLFSFGISWIFGLVIFLTGRIESSPELVPNSGITLAFVLTASGYMWGPAFAHILTRLVTRAGWKDLYLKPQIRRAWKLLLAGWFLPGLLTLLGTLCYFLIFPDHFDTTLSLITNQAPTANNTNDLYVYILIQIAISLLISGPLNLIATFGEEFGWRGFLLPAMLPYGKRKALVLSSIIWGIWHWPMVLMGHNYGLDYWGYPWLGLAVTVCFTLAIGVYFGWLSLKGGSVWPAVLAHGSLNGMASVGMLFLSRPPYLVLGPSPAGLIGLIPFVLVSGWILWKNPIMESNKK